MNRSEYVSYEFGVELERYAGVYTLLHQVVVASGLENRHIVFFFIAADVACHAHSLRKQFEQFVVETVDLLSE